MVLDKATGELVERSTYQAYGGVESDYRPGRWQGFREDYRFTGKEEDVEVGLQYFGFRFLNPLLGRWMSADPLAVHGLGADPNLYAYVSGAALKNVDPLGLDEYNDCSVSSCQETQPVTEQGEDGTNRTQSISSEANSSCGDREYCDGSAERTQSTDAPQNVVNQTEGKQDEEESAKSESDTELVDADRERRRAGDAFRETERSKAEASRKPPEPYDYRDVTVSGEALYGTRGARGDLVAHVNQTTDEEVLTYTTSDMRGYGVSAGFSGGLAWGTDYGAARRPLERFRVGPFEASSQQDVKGRTVMEGFSVALPFSLGASGGYTQEEPIKEVELDRNPAFVF